MSQKSSAQCGGHVGRWCCILAFGDAAFGGIVPECKTTAAVVLMMVMVMLRW